MNSLIKNNTRVGNSRNSGKTIKICLWGGWYGSKNVGDKTVLITITKLLRDRIRNSRFVVLSENAKDVEGYMAEEGIEVLALNKWRQIYKTLHALATADLLIIGGGVPFYDKLSHALVCAFFVIVAKIFGCRVMTYAVATQILNSRLIRLIYKNILRKLDLITVRDPKTLTEFKNLGINRQIVLTADPGLTLKMTDTIRVNEIFTEEGIEERNSRPLIGITIRSLSSSHPYRREHYRQLSSKDIFKVQESVARAADFLTKIGQVVFIPMHTVDPDDDRSMAKAIIRKMKKSSEVNVISKQYSPAEIMGVISRCSFFFGTRTHSIILAAASNVPFVIGVFDLKLVGIAKSLKMDEYAPDLIEVDSDELISMIENAWEERDKISQKLKQSVSDLKKLVDLNADLAAKLCFREEIYLDKILTFEHSD